MLPTSSIREAIACIDRSGHCIGLVTDHDQRLLDTITDGDVRRAMLAGLSLDSSVSQLLARKGSATKRKPITARIGTSRQKLLRLMKTHGVRQIPLLDAKGHVAGLSSLDELRPDHLLPMQAVIMAGGFGKRLRPLTDGLPKPMLPVGDSPLMQLTIEHLRQAGIRQVYVTTHFMPDKIQDYFGDGRRFGVELQYVNEQSPLGTAGFLSMLAPLEEPLLVINGDILTQVDYRALLAFHREHAADLTVAVRKYEFKVPYGVVESEGTLVRRVVEKPVMEFHVNGGIYLLEPVVRRFLPENQPFDMTDLIETLIKAGRTVACFLIREYWLDIGHLADYEQAQEDIKKWRIAA